MRKYAAATTSLRHMNSRQSQPVFRTLALLACVALTCVSLVGCVRRRLNIQSNPPGALVYVDNQQIGTTPCAVDFIYYGTREIRLIKPGYDTLTINQPIPTPWYEVPPIDFVSEVLVPYKIRDNRTVAFNLQPQLMIPTEELIERGNQLRQATYQQQPTAAPVITMPGVAPVITTPAATPAPSIIPPPAMLPPNGATPLPPLAAPPANFPYNAPAGPGVVLPTAPVIPSPQPPFRY
jgi:hypothetical protein